MSRVKGRGREEKEDNVSPMGFLRSGVEIDLSLASS